MKLIIKIVPLVMILAATVLSAQYHGRGHNNGHRQTGWFQGLTEEQKAEVRDLISDLKSEGATREEIHAAVSELFTSWGLTPPEFNAGRGGRFGFMGDLTEEQRQELRELVNNLRSEGANREEIHAAVSELFTSWGLTPPEFNAGRGGRFGFMGDLTEEQRQELRELVNNLRSEGATREEIHAAVSELFTSWGLTPPEFNAGRGGRFGFMGDLTEEQRQELRELVNNLRSEGATREEIHEAIRKFFIDNGLTPPDFSEEDRSRRNPRGKKIKAVNFPNPFNPSTTIEYSLESSSPVSVTIMDLSGRTVRAFNLGEKGPGSHRITWDGRRADGSPVPSGLYFYMIKAGNNNLTESMLLLK